jgi:hypothetical protein
VAEGSLEEDWDMLAPKKIKVRERLRLQYRDEALKAARPQRLAWAAACSSRRSPLWPAHVPTLLPFSRCSPRAQDPKATKPADWDERPKIPDPEDKKPAGWDDIPATIADPDAKKPEDWDDEDDGEWEPPMIPNPEFKGEWKQKM